MPPAKKRKTAAKRHVVTAETQPDPVDDAPPVDESINQSNDQSINQSIDQPIDQPSQYIPEPSTAEAAAAPAPDFISEPSSVTVPTPAPAPAPINAMNARLAKQKALQDRVAAGLAANLEAARAEAHRQKHDPAQLAPLRRKADIANVKLLKADIEAAGGDFERKRAFDWTIDEADKWDERQAEKAAHRDNNAFQDFGAEAAKVYDRQLRNMGAPDLDRYRAQNLKKIEDGVARGSLQMLEAEDGRVLAVDRDGSFDAISSFADSRPSKEAVDRLVGTMKKNDEVAAKKRRERLAKNGQEDGDVTYINDANKRFNQKADRFYNKYTAEVRDSFERGTAI